VELGSAWWHYLPFDAHLCHYFGGSDENLSPGSAVLDFWSRGLARTAFVEYDREVMKATLSIDDILEIGQPQIEEMRRISENYPSGDAPGAGEAFGRQVRIVEGIVSQT
jgi:hypothetical protein